MSQMLTDTMATDTTGTTFLIRDTGFEVMYVTPDGHSYTPVGAITPVTGGGGGGSGDAAGLATLHTDNTTTQTALGTANTALSQLHTDSQAEQTDLTQLHTDMGVAATGDTEPAGGTGLMGFLSGIFKALTSTLSVGFATLGKQTVANSLSVVVTTPSSTFNANGYTVATANQAQRLVPTSTPINDSVTLQTGPSNVAPIMIGPTISVASAPAVGCLGFPLYPKQSLTMRIDDLTNIYMNSPNTTDVLFIVGN